MKNQRITLFLTANTIVTPWLAYPLHGTPAEARTRISGLGNHGSIQLNYRDMTDKDLQMNCFYSTNILPNCLGKFIKI
jgi:hypothetical protein